VRRCVAQGAPAIRDTALHEPAIIIVPAKAGEALFEDFALIKACGYGPRSSPG